MEISYHRKFLAWYVHTSPEQKRTQNENTPAQPTARALFIDSTKETMDTRMIEDSKEDETNELISMPQTKEKETNKTTLLEDDQQEQGFAETEEETIEADNLTNPTTSHKNKTETQDPAQKMHPTMTMQQAK